MAPPARTHRRALLRLGRGCAQGRGWNLPSPSGVSQPAATSRRLSLSPPDRGPLAGKGGLRAPSTPRRNALRGCPLPSDSTWGSARTLPPPHGSCWGHRPGARSSSPQSLLPLCLLDPPLGGGAHCSEARSPAQAERVCALGLREGLVPSIPVPWHFQHV